MNWCIEHECPYDMCAEWHDGTRPQQLRRPAVQNPTILERDRVFEIWVVVVMAFLLGLGLGILGSAK